ncbi:MoaD/ThiS family protein [Methanoplanus sp. FWC-SCC4]|uniref:MoaD/ThiS family protein n=1 Tax=Methanochimaera problematica TaxID=2609417 RepID=A0AA97FFD4_9EURY|nr:ubiquitin-like small modifier protein 1 [Methanoplanus sp. FWC-SCC4]WOF17003.1 MoaD/ThiS family protein [Methanoplanus sp. FWC-SCC4]
MKVTIKSFATLRKLMDKELILEIKEGATVGDTIKELTQKYDGLFNELFESSGVIRPYVNILVNGKNIHFIDKLETKLKDEDIISLFPPIAGG